ncbi:MULTISPECIES: HelD family protein [unclassified Nocardioides]|uniref:HelD family protein n=1 Tax=unclassified Nocardioides TaxID=2615069 RepID=UPI0007030D5E|nr:MULTISPECIES: ATP-binding domain-containing protein [unclassified Nocardioides]KRC53366.1 hypothetical protein ASE19_13525 [Nocardioides sp. Root79]KRC70703.1 hypothetical protein ASE20_12370 [Nocardioides sp. Root240]
MTAMHPELQDEQAFVDRAYQLLDKGLADAERNMGEYKAQHRSTAQALQRALRILKESRGTGQLVFGKMTLPDDETLYVGRRRVRDEDFNPVVVGWHADAAQVFYEASPQNPRGLSLKRVFTEEERRLVRVIDEIVGASAAQASEAAGTGMTFGDALLEELDRSRDGAMRDVVATIQAEQYAIIRHPLAGVVVVQGGPGTGKTVVGLHRAAWLAFNYPELRREGILVVAPSTTFLTYVSGVLPSLDVTDVDQVELQALYAGEADIIGLDAPETARVKGSAGMAATLAAALQQRIGWREEELVLSLGADRIRLDGREIQEMIAGIVARGLPHADGREVIRDALATMAADRHRQDQAEQGRPVRANEATIRRLSSFVNAVDRMWPSYTPEEFLRTLYATQAWLVRATDGLMTADERARLYRPLTESVTTEPWTEADLFCLDEIAGLLTRDTVTYGHLVVDEAQDLSPMQARALARRCPSGSFTILGDLAQTTGPWVRDSWTELSAHLSQETPSVLNLSIGYRVPSDVLDLAAHQLPLAGPGLKPPTSIRRGRGAPEVIRTDSEGLKGIAAETAGALLADGLTTAVIVPDAWYDEWLVSEELVPLAPGDGRDGDFAHNLTLVAASGCKGLEFDAVILVEPAVSSAASVQPPRALYVAMTRCTQSLSIVHADALPAGFGDQQNSDEHHRVPPSADDVEVAANGREALIELVERLEMSDVILVAALVRRLIQAEDEELTGEQ